MMVALSHCLLVLTIDGLDNIWYASFSEVAGVQSALTRFMLIFLNGGAAVTVFFVLSGYVLGLSLDKHKVTVSRTLSFYLKRVFRLYPAHIVSLLAIVASMVAFHEYQVFVRPAGRDYSCWKHLVDVAVTSNLLLGRPEQKFIHLSQMAGIVSRV